MMRRPLLATAAGLSLWACLLGCPKKPDQKPQVDPDANSGPDALRSGALKIEVNKVSPPDDVNFDKQDMTDWKAVDLTGRPAQLTVFLRWDNVNSDINVDVFDAVGNQLISSPGPAPGTTEKKVAVDIVQVPATYYIRVTAPKTKDGSVYTVEPKWEGEVQAMPQVPQEPPPEVKPTPKPKVHSEPKPKKEKGSTAEQIAEKGLQGRIRSASKEGDGMVLYIDKGSAAGVKAGQRGTILDGPNGANPLPGAMFTIENVVDENKCTAKTSLRSLGKNNRVAIDVK